MTGYGTREVAKMLGLSAAQVRSYVRAGFLAPERGPRGELRFSFQDLVLLRTAQGLLSARIPQRRVKRALRRLRGQLPEGRTLRDVQIRAEGDRIVVGEGGRRLCAESGQVLLDFGTAELTRKVAPLVRRVAKSGGDGLSAADYYERGCDLDEAAPHEAREAYRRALELDPRHADAHVNLGRLLHVAGDARAAAEHYRLALDARPEDVTAAFNLGVALEDLGLASEALDAYARAVDTDPACADAHYNLSRLYERAGKGALAIRHLRAYQKLTESA